LNTTIDQRIVSFAYSKFNSYILSGWLFLQDPHPPLAIESNISCSKSMHVLKKSVTVPKKLNYTEPLRILAPSQKAENELSRNNR
jgi:hypothetical protein